MNHPRHHLNLGRARIDYSGFVEIFLSETPDVQISILSAVGPGAAIHAAQVYDVGTNLMRGHLVGGTLKTC